MFRDVRFQAIRSAEGFAAIDDVASKRFFAGMRSRVSLEMMRRGEGLLATGSETTEGTLARVRANVLAEIAAFL